jgi:hypothetical protein
LIAPDASSEHWHVHLLTAPEREQFEADGYLVVPGVLARAQTEAILRVAWQMDSDFRSSPHVGPHHVLNRHDLIGADAAFLELIDLPRVFPKVFGILGWNIQCFHTQLLVTPPAPPGAAHAPYGWHQDNNRMNLDFEIPPPHPRVSVKVGYFLTDLLASGMGNLCVVPGSHVRGRPPADAVPEAMTEIRATAGDAVLFDRRLWHAASTNTSEHTRVFLTYGYSYRWLRPKSAMEVGDLVEMCDPIRRQLLGASPSGPNGYFDPQPEDVPLRAQVHLLEPSQGAT